MSNFAELKRQMIEYQMVARGLRDESVLNALSTQNVYVCIQVIQNTHVHLTEYIQASMHVATAKGGKITS